MLRRARNRVAQLEAQLGAVSLAPSQRRRRRPVRRRRANNNGFHDAPGAVGNGPGPSGMRVQNSPNGMVLSREELWQEITPVAASDVVKGLSFVPGASGLSFLDALAKSFERYQLHSFIVEWKPSCGTTRDGAIILGVDWDPADTGSTLGYAQSLEPRIRVPVWQGKQMILPPARLMSRRFLLVSGDAGKGDNPDYAAFQVVAAITKGETKAAGEVWVRYRISFHGPTAGARNRENASGPPIGGTLGGPLQGSTLTPQHK
jgi:hypothetical protein